MNRSGAVSLFLLAIFAIRTDDALAAEYDYEIVWRGALDDFQAKPVLANDGSFTWGGHGPVGNERVPGVFRWKQGETAALIDFRGRFETVFSLAVSPGGEGVAFSTVPVDTPDGIYAYELDAGQPRLIAAPQETGGNVFLDAVNDRGDALINVATFTPPATHGNTEFIYRGGTLTSFAAFTNLPTVFGGGSINNSGLVGFQVGEYLGPRKTLLIDEHAATPVLEYPEDGILFSPPLMNDAGGFTFHGTVGESRGVFDWNAGIITPLTIEPPGPPIYQGAPLFNRVGGVLINTLDGLLAGFSPTDVVFPYEPPGFSYEFVLGDLRLTSFQEYGFNDRGQIWAMMNVTSPTGRTLEWVVVLATPVPEPAGVAGLMAVLAAAAIWRRPRVL